MLDPLIILFGLGVGILVGLTGIGGGSLMTPLLVLFAGVQPGRRHRHRPRLRRDHQDAGRLAAPAQGHRRPRRLEVAGGRQRPGLAARRADRRPAARRLRHGLRRPSCSSASPSRCSSSPPSILARALFMPRAGRARARDRRADHARHAPAPPASASCSACSSAATSVGSGALIGLALILVFRLTPAPRRRHRRLPRRAAAVGGRPRPLGRAATSTSALMANILIGSLPGVWIGDAR